MKRTYRMNVITEEKKSKSMKRKKYNKDTTARAHRSKSAESNQWDQQETVESLRLTKFSKGRNFRFRRASVFIGAFQRAGSDFGAALGQLAKLKTLLTRYKGVEASNPRELKRLLELSASFQVAV